MKSGTAILEVFYQAAGQFVTREELSRSLDQPTGAVAAEIAGLEKLGYKIETHPHHGYRLIEAPDRLTADDIRARLKTQVIGSEILVFDETASTNDVVEHLARNNAREGLVVFAESQTKGRGRHGRTWVSPRGKGLWFSILLRPELLPAAAPRLTVAASVAVARAIRHASGVDARIKWPNDVIARDRKLAGILTELRAESGAIAHAILGVGIDVNCAEKDFPPAVGSLATSLMIETGEAHDRARLAAEVLAELDVCYQAAQTSFDSIVDEWARLCTTLGKQVVAQVGLRRFEGYAQALDDDGALLVRKDNGQVERIMGGDLVEERG